MKTRAIFTLTVLAGMATAASAQTATLSWNWNRASDPIETPAPAALEPGEAARVWLNISYTAGSAADVRGLASIFIDLNATDARGEWVNSGTGFNGTEMGLNNFNFTDWGHRSDLLPQSASAWNMLGVASWGTYNAPDGSVTAVQAGQIGAPGGSATVSSANPVNEIWRGQFAPESYAARTIVWDGAKAFASPNTGVALYTRATGGTAFQTLHIPIENIDFGSLSIPVVPSPSSLALLGLGGLIIARRRR